MQRCLLPVVFPVREHYIWWKSTEWLGSCYAFDVIWVCKYSKRYLGDLCASRNYILRLDLTWCFRFVSLIFQRLKMSLGKCTVVAIWKLEIKHSWVIRCACVWVFPHWLCLRRAALICVASLLNWNSWLAGRIGGINSLIKCLLCFHKVYNLQFSCPWVVLWSV